MRQLLLVVLAMLPLSCAAIQANAPIVGHFVVARHPHDQSAFTQGLVFHDGFLYESTGLYGRSSVRKVELETGRVLMRTSLPDDMFGEGLTIWDNEVLQLTWREQVVLRYTLADLTETGRLTIPHEGWGLTHEGRLLIVSDGSATLRFVDPHTFKLIHTITARDGYRKLTNLNELEYIEGEIWANIWKKELIARIDPTDGTVLGYIDLTGLLTADERRIAGVANGIAHDPAIGAIYITGKNWPWLFEIKVLPSP
ncbi:MAG TPA: glutamine cyclotransferase [Desulfofustis sp.]|nr:glutamine cyclotransferase [Desulfofustis sp.]